MNQTPNLLSCFEELDVAITITNLEGKLIYMNQRAAEVNAQAGGKDLVGQQVRNCHSERSRAIIESLFAGATNAYTIDKQGLRKLIYQTPWRVDGQIQGLIEFSIVIPQEMPHYVRA